MNKIAILGAGGFGREVKFLLDQINTVDSKFEIIGFYDDNESLPKIINGIPYLGPITNLLNISQPLGLVLGVGSPTLKRQFYERLKVNNFLYYTNLIHPTVNIGNDNVKLGFGNIIFAGSILSIDINLGNFNTINLMCTIGHDVQIGDFCTINPGARISGTVKLGDLVFIGVGGI